jgi:ERCC4-type nuclease
MDAEETSRLLVCLGRQASRFAHGALPRSGYRPKGKRARQSFILQGLPGVGPERAKRLLDHFGSIAQIVATPVAELAAVPGIGEATATRIRWALD